MIRTITTHPAYRRVVNSRIVRTGKAIFNVVERYAPKWLIAVSAIMAAIPGPEEVILLPIFLYVGVRNPQMFGEITTAARVAWAA